MATITFKVDTPSTTNASAYPSGNLSPTVGDLIVAFVTASGTVALATMSYSGVELTFTRITTALKNTSADSLYLFVSNGFALTAGVRTVTFDCTGDAATGAIITVYSISGMSRAGLGAVRQSAVVNNGTGGTTPAPAFGSAALTSNPVLGMVGNGASPAGMTPPTGTTPTWTEGSDSGYITPTNGQETIWAASGFTGTTITWGSTSASAFGSIIVELDASSFPAGEDDTPPRLKQEPSEPEITVWQ